MFLFEKFDKNINLIRVSVGQVTFLSEDWKSCLSEATSSLGFHFRDSWKESIYKTDGTKRICFSQQDLRFRVWPIYAGFTQSLGYL